MGDGGGSAADDPAAPRPLAVQLYTLRRELEENADAVFLAIAEIGFPAVETVSQFGLARDQRAAAAGWALPAETVRRLADRYGLRVCAAHTGLPEGPEADAVLAEQELLENDLLIVSSLGAVCGLSDGDLDRRDTLERVADRFNAAAARAAKRGMRIGFHNHHWEWRSAIDGRPGYEVLWDHLDPSVVAEVDMYWAQVAGRDPADVIAKLGRRAQLAHVKDGPLEAGRPNTAVGTGSASIAGPLAAAPHMRWHVVEFDECATDTLVAVAASARWLVEAGISQGRDGARFGDRGTAAR